MNTPEYGYEGDHAFMDYDVMDDAPAEEQPTEANATADPAARPEVRAALRQGHDAAARGDKIGAMLAQTVATMLMVAPLRPPTGSCATCYAPPVTNGPGAGEVVHHVNCPHFAPTLSAHLDGCSADEDPDGETMCVCASIERERAAYDPREEKECQAEFIDGSWYGDDCPDCRRRCRAEMDDCEQCQEEDYCSKHQNGVYG